MWTTPTSTSPNSQPASRPRLALLAVVGVLGGAAVAFAPPGSAATATSGGGAEAHAAQVSLTGHSSASGLSLGLGLSASSPLVTAPASPGTASNGAGLSASGAGAATARVGVATNAATRTATSTSARSEVSSADITGFGTTLLTADEISGTVGCPSGGAQVARTSQSRVTLGGRAVDAAAGATAQIPVSVGGLTGAEVTASVSSPHASTTTTASATGLLVSLTLHATVPVVGTAVDVPLGSVALAHTTCSRPAASSGTTAPPTGGGGQSTPDTAPGTGSGTAPETGPGSQPGSTATGPGTSSRRAAVVPAPTVLAIDPDQGPTAGGQRVTIVGHGFTPAAAVTFDGRPATHVVVGGGGTAISATTPADTAGPADVVIGQPSGHATLPGGYTYIPPGGPTIASIAATSGPSAGGQTVVVQGTGFGAGTTVRFGGVAASHVQAAAPTVLTAVTPAHVAGVVTVTVTNPNGSSGTRAYRYVAPAGSAAAARTPCALSNAADSRTGMSSTAFRDAALGVLLGAVVALGGAAGARRLLRRPTV